MDAWTFLGRIDKGLGRIDKERYGDSENDPDATREGAGREVRSQQQGFARDVGYAGIHGNRRSEEEWSVRAPWPRPPGACRAQGAHGPQSGNWRSHQDRG